MRKRCEKLVLAPSNLAQVVLLSGQDALGGGARLHLALQRACLLLKLRDHEQALAGSTDRRVALRGQHVSVPPADFEQGLCIGADAKPAHRVGAEQREGVTVGDLFPKLLQPYRRAVPTLRAQQPHHFAEGAHGRVAARRPRDEWLDDLCKAPLLRPAVKQ